MRVHKENLTSEHIQSTQRLYRTRSVRSENDKVIHYVKPMLAYLHEKPFDDPEWIFEVKWDGYRAIAEIGKDEIKLYSRNGLSFLRLYPAVAEELKKIKEDVILDGEIIVLNQQNKPDFQKLQQYDHHRSLQICYYVFDCLSYNGKSMLHHPLLERKKKAQEVLIKSKIIRYSDHVLQSGVEFFTKVVQMDLEGMIAKKATSHYYPGKRSREWLKIKNHNTQEAVIAGYTEPRGSREYFGALILGIYRNKKLKYIGHTGTGFTAATLESVYKTLKPLKRDTSPFDQKIVVNSPVTWVEPVIVCAIKFTEITEEGILRHPVFLGLRMDKTAGETTTMDVKATLQATTPETKGLKTKTAKKNTAKKEQKILVNGHDLTLSNQDKIYWPEDNITKGDLIQYYNTISNYLLPYLKNRPQSLRRNPNGIRDKGFFHKDAGHAAPDWVDTVSIASESTDKNIEYIVCNNKATLLYLNNLGCIELNPWNSRISKLNYPDYLVIDLDPSEKNSFEQVVEGALVVKEILDQAGAPSYCKTSGATGLHLYIPLKAQYTYDDIGTLAEVIARMAQERLPHTTTVERTLSKRNGRIYLDYLQNKRGQTLASVYSVRPMPGAPVSAPLLWKEVKKGLHPSQFTIFNMENRLRKTGDLFSGVLQEKINLKKCLKNLGV